MDDFSTLSQLILDALGETAGIELAIVFGSLAASLLRQHLFDAADFLPYRDRILEERRRAWIGA